MRERWATQWQMLTENQSKFVGKERTNGKKTFEIVDLVSFGNPLSWIDAHFSCCRQDSHLPEQCQKAINRWQITHNHFPYKTERVYLFWIRARVCVCVCGCVWVSVDPVSERKTEWAYPMVMADVKTMCRRKSHHCRNPSHPTIAIHHKANSNQTETGQHSPFHSTFYYNKIKFSSCWWKILM